MRERERGAMGHWKLVDKSILLKILIINRFNINLNLNMLYRNLIWKEQVNVII